MTYDPDPAITLTWPDVMAAGLEGTRRFITARRRQRPTGNGRWDADKSLVEFDMVGALAECAFAKKLGVPWAPLDRPDRYEAGHDVAGWEVKGTRYSREQEPHLPAPLSAEPEALYVLLAGWTGIANLHEWLILGWGIGADLFEDRWIRTSPRGPECYWIPSHALVPWPPLPSELERPHLPTNGLRP